MSKDNTHHIYDVLVIGGGPVGLSAAYEVSKAQRTVAVVEKHNFFNQAGSSGDLSRMYRTMYTEDYMADLAHETLDMWRDLERDAGEGSLRLMTGLLNFGDPEYGASGPEGTLNGPIDNLRRLNMPYTKLTKDDIEARFPFKNLPEDYQGVYAPDNGTINVPLLVRTLHRLAREYGAHLHQYAAVSKAEPYRENDRQLWKVLGTSEDGHETVHLAEKLIIAAGAYTNHILTPSFNIHLELQIWEMAAMYFSTKPGPQGNVFPCMWFQFAENKDTGESQLFYGFPSVPWGPPNLARIAVDSATRIIKDPSQRLTNIVNPDDIGNVQQYIKEHITGVDHTVPAYSLSCMQTNVFDNMFVLDFLPEQYLGGGVKDSVAIFTAGWGMKFVPLIGRALKELVLDGKSKFSRPEFSITREDPHGNGIIGEGPISLNEPHVLNASSKVKGSLGSSMRRRSFGH